MNFLFDVDDTLYDQILPFQKAYTCLFSKYDIDVPTLYIKSRQYSDEVFALQQAGIYTVEQSGVYRIRKAMQDYGIDLSFEEALSFQREYAKQQGLISVSKELIEVLDYLKHEQVPMGIITNGPKEHQLKKLKALDIKKWFDDKNVFISGEIGYAKPDIAIFDYVEKHMHIDKETTIFIGDSYENDIVGANHAGWKTIWINRRNKEVLNPVCDWMITDIKELLPLIQKIQVKDNI